MAASWAVGGKKLLPVLPKTYPSHWGAPRTQKPPRPFIHYPLLNSLHFSIAFVSLTMIRPTLCLLFIAVVAASSVAPSTARRLSYSDGSAKKSPRAVYTMSNDLTSNSIIAIPIDPATGLLLPSAMTMTPTGGKGGQGTNNGSPVATDQLFSQGAVVAQSQLLFAVNAGSNTVSMFKIDAANPTMLQMVGMPQDTMGDFPVSVDYSPRQVAEGILVLDAGVSFSLVPYHMPPAPAVAHIEPSTGLSA
jgi:hypothetical protein